MRYQSFRIYVTELYFCEVVVYKMLLFICLEHECSRDEGFLTRQFLDLPLPIHLYSNQYLRCTAILPNLLERKPFLLKTL